MEPDLTDYLGPPGGPAPITTRDVNGFRLSCISYTEKVAIAVQTWCITGRGVLGYIAGAGFLRGIELVSLSFTVPKDEFSLPSKPTRWHGFEDKDGAGVRASRICLLRDRLVSAASASGSLVALRQEPSPDLLHSLNEPPDEASRAHGRSTPLCQTDSLDSLRPWQT